MVMVGANPEQLEQLAGAFDNAVTIIDQGVRGPITANLGSNLWEGDDAVTFRSDWSATLNPLLLNAANFLRGGAVSLRAQAEQQRVASEEGGGGGYGAGGGTGTGSGSDPGTSPVPKQNLTGPDLLSSVVSGVKLVSRGMKLPRTIEKFGSWLENPSNSPGAVRQGAADGVPATGSKGYSFTDKLSMAGSGFGILANGMEILADPSFDDLDDYNKYGGLIANTTGLIDVAAKSPLGKTLPFISGTIGAVGDGIDAYQAFQQGDYLKGVYHIAHGAAAVAGVFFPPVAIGLAVWDVGKAAYDFLDSTGLIAPITDTVGEVLDQTGEAIGNGIDAVGDFFGGLF